MRLLLLALLFALLLPASADALTKQKKVILFVNQERAKRGLVKVKPHPALMKAARIHSRNMYRRQKLYHGNVGKRVQRYGYRYRVIGECVGRAYTPRQVVRLWMRSKSHRRVLLDKRFRDIGAGHHRNYYTVDMGRKR